MNDNQIYTLIYLQQIKKKFEQKKHIKKKMLMISNINKHGYYDSGK